MNLTGATVFLCCGGPLLNEHELELLSEHGLLIAAVNNAPVAMWRRWRIRPHLWFSVDSPKFFHHDIFIDPGCQKFVRREFCAGDQHVGQGPREQWKASKNDVRLWHDSGRWAPWQPATLFPNVELYDAGICAAHQSAMVLEGIKPTWRVGDRSSVLLVALWFLNRFKVGTINLLGCDLHMDYQQPYAWEQRKSATGVASSNETLHWLRDTMLPILAAQLKERGTKLRRLAPGELATAVREGMTHQPFRYASGLYELE